MPSALRKELDNNPANLLLFIQDEKNKERCYEYGLLNKPIMEAPKAPVVVNPNPVNPVSINAPDTVLHTDSDVK